MQKGNHTLEVNEHSPLMTFLIQHLKDKSRDNIKSLLKYKQVWVNGKPVSQYNHMLHTGERVEIRQARITDLPPQHYLSIIYEDDHLIVVDKQAGLLSVSNGHEHVTAYGIVTDWVKKQHASNRIFIVHRLDQYTSGLLMFAKSENVQHILRNDWKTFITERTYTAVVEGEVKKTSGKISSYLIENKSYVMLSGQDPLKGKLAVTRFKTLKSNKHFSLLQLNLETGKKNQIRVHMQDIGHSIAGDRKYGARSNPVGRLCLHATILAFKHPVTGKALRFESEIPADFNKLFYQ